MVSSGTDTQTPLGGKQESDIVTDLVLRTLSEDGIIENTDSLRRNNEKIDQQLVLGVLKSLRSRDMVKFSTLEKEFWTLTAEGNEIEKSGSHEAKLFHALPPRQGGGAGKGVAPELLKKKLGDVAKFGQGRAFQKKWIGKTAEGLLVRLVDQIEDTTQAILRELKQTGAYGNTVALNDLRKRKLCEKRKHQSFRVEKDREFSVKIETQETDLTFELVQSGEWKHSRFKRYNFDAEGVKPDQGHLHPLMKMREEVQQVFMEMGFTEMTTDNHVEIGLWNFDALFVPQVHPARDLQDTFFVKDPKPDPGGVIDQELLESYAKVHSEGAFGSLGHGSRFSKAESEKLVLRTHTTASTARCLYHLSRQPGGLKSAKRFSIDRVFRNETVDKTHLAEFHQVEGLVAGKGISLAHLLGFMEAFFSKLGLKKLTFKPAYNPYTEPSLEIFAWHEGFAKWIEVGNSGVFRPEMIRPLGVPEDINVLGWGLSLERPTMIKYGITDIRDLVGHQVRLDLIEKSPFCRLATDC